MSGPSADGSINVPKGGGALTGMGETFQPDLHTGTGNLTVPIPLPAGRRGLTPSLSLAYSTGAGNGPFGLGWSMSVPLVSRRTDRGIPRYDDTRDTFVLSGAEELVPVPLGTAIPPAGASGITLSRYRPRTEAGFARITHLTGNGDDYWEVWAKDGLRSRYGTPQPQPTGAAPDWTDPAVIVNHTGGIFTWLLTETVDPLGNRIAYRYTGDGGGGPSATSPRLPTPTTAIPLTPTTPYTSESCTRTKHVPIRSVTAGLALSCARRAAPSGLRCGRPGAPRRRRPPSRSPTPTRTAQRHALGYPC